jgi:cell division protein FtsI (penicillin-binding protein 3)
VSTIANGGVLIRPTLLAQEDSVTEHGPRLMQPATSDVMRKLMRLVVTEGYGKAADVPGYFVGGKTGTAEKTGAHGYKKHANVSAFISVFPMQAPRYAVYMMLDEPHGNKSTGWYSTAGQVSAPAAGRVIGRIGPMLGLFPATADAAAIQASLAIPLQPGHGYGMPARHEVPTAAARPDAGRPQPAAGSAPVPASHDPRHEATLPTPAGNTPSPHLAAR